MAKNGAQCIFVQIYNELLALFKYSPKSFATSAIFGNCTMKIIAREAKILSLSGHSSGDYGRKSTPHTVTNFLKVIF
jgi:hypothetical protein